MGLAPYGQPKYVERVSRVIRVKADGLFDLDERYFRHVKEGVAMRWEAGIPEIGTLYSDYFVEQFWSGPAPRRAFDGFSPGYGQLGAAGL